MADEEWEIVRKRFLENYTMIAEEARAKAVAGRAQRQFKDPARDTVLKIFTWNIQSLSKTAKKKKEYDEDGKRKRSKKEKDITVEQDEGAKKEEKTKDRLEMLAGVILRYKPDVMALQEVRWSGQGCKEFEAYNIYYSCNKIAGQHGTAFVVPHVLQEFGIKFTPVDSRLCVFRIEKLSISFINVYAPTNNADSEFKDNFYVILDKIYDDCPRSDIKLVLGDANARIGKESFYRRYAGCHSLHEVTNNNGVRLINFAVSKNMRLGSTYFMRRDTYKGTYIDKTTNQLLQIDHVLINNEHIRRLTNVRTYREYARESDHFLVGAKLRVKITGNVRETINDDTKNESLPLERETVLREVRRYITNNLPFIDHRSFSIMDILRRSQLSDDKEDELKKRIEDWLDVDLRAVQPHDAQKTHDLRTNEGPGEFSRPEIKELMTQIRAITADDNLIYESLSNVLYDSLRRSLCVGIDDKSVIRQICILRRILGAAFKCDEIVYHLFVDLENAYDRLPRQMLYEAMSELDISKRTIYLTELIVEHEVRMRYDTSKSWKARRGGLNGGGALSQLLFHILLRKIIRDTGMDGNIYGSRKLQIVAYGCHMDIIVRSSNEMCAISDVTGFLSALKRENINANRMKLTETACKQKLAIYREHYSKLYLGYFVNMHNAEYSRENVSNDIKRKSMLANMCYYELAEYFNSERIEWGVKIRMYNTLLIPVLTYALDTSKLCASDEEILSSFHKRIFGVIRRKISDTDEEAYVTSMEKSYNDMIKDIKRREMLLRKDINKYSENLQRAFVGPKKRTRSKKKRKPLVESDSTALETTNEDTDKLEE